MFALGCEGEEPPPSVPKSRAAAVTAAAPAAPAPAATSAAAAPVAAPKRQLCDGQLSGAGKELPDEKLSRSGAPALPASIASGGGAWTWINFWAAWCVPCREEIPRLKEWEKKLAQAKPSLRLTFVSLDDDERQLQDFLAAQPETGLRATYWLKDGKEREDWMAEAGLEADPELPAHLLVDPAGKIRCAVKGAVEDSDFPRVQEILGG